EPRRYLVLGDFGGPAAAPAAVDRDTLDAVLQRQGIELGGARIRELEDFHPDRLYQSLDIFRDLRDACVPAAEPQAATPKPDIEKILRPSSLLEQIAEGGDSFDQYVRELARSQAAAPAAARTSQDAVRSERMRAVLRHPRFQSLEAAWRGLDFVVRRLDDSSSRVHIAQFSKRELAEDLLETK